MEIIGFVFASFSKEGCDNYRNRYNSITTNWIGYY